MWGFLIPSVFQIFYNKLNLTFKILEAIVSLKNWNSSNLEKHYCPPVWCQLICPLFLTAFVYCGEPSLSQSACAIFWQLLLLKPCDEPAWGRSPRDTQSVDVRLPGGSALCWHCPVESECSLPWTSELCCLQHPKWWSIHYRTFFKWRTCEVRGKKQCYIPISAMWTFW